MVLTCSLSHFTKTVDGSGATCAKLNVTYITVVKTTYQYCDQSVCCLQIVISGPNIALPGITCIYKRYKKLVGAVIASKIEIASVGFRARDIIRPEQIR